VDTKIRTDRRYTKDHEWVLAANGGVFLVGVSDYAQHALGDIVMVELPDVGDTVDAGDAVATIESPKSVSDVFSPLSGEIIEQNEALYDRPETINEDPFDGGWLFKIKASDPGEYDALMDAAAYGEHVAALEDA